MGGTKKIGYLGDTKIPKLVFIEKEYKKRREDIEQIKNIIDKIPLKQKSKSRLGSHYDYAIKHRDMYFTRSDFTTAIVQGRNGSHNFSETTAIELLQKNFPEVWTKLSKIINTGVRQHEVVDYRLKETLSDEFHKIYEEELKSITFVHSQLKPYVEKIDNLDSFLLASKANEELAFHIISLDKGFHPIGEYLNILANGKTFDNKTVFSIEDYATVAIAADGPERKKEDNKIIEYLDSNFEKFSEKSEKELNNIMRVTEISAIERGVTKEVATRIIELNNEAKKIHNVFYKMLSLGENRICGAIKFPEGSMSFAYDLESGEIITQGANTEHIPKILGIGLDEAEVVKYLASHILESEDLEIDIIPKEFHFSNQKTTDTILYRNDREELEFALIEREFPPYGLALPGGMVDPNEKSFDANLRELKEELNADNIKVMQDLGVREGLEVRGSIKTRLLVVKAVNPSEVKAGDDANSFQWLKEDEIREKIEKGELIPHHIKYIEEGMDFIKNGIQIIESILPKTQKEDISIDPTTIKQ